jgi:hypothetical protein
MNGIGRSSGAIRAIPVHQDHLALGLGIARGAGNSRNTPGSGRPLVIFAPRFVVVKALGYVGGDSWILGVCDRRAVLLFDFFASAFTGKSLGFRGFLAAMPLPVANHFLSEGTDAEFDLLASALMASWCPITHPAAAPTLPCPAI